MIFPTNTALALQHIRCLHQIINFEDIYLSFRWEILVIGIRCTYNSQLVTMCTYIWTTLCLIFVLLVRRIWFDAKSIFWWKMRWNMLYLFWTAFCKLWWEGTMKKNGVLCIKALFEMEISNKHVTFRFYVDQITYICTN